MQNFIGGYCVLQCRIGTETAKLAANNIKTKEAGTQEKSIVKKCHKKQNSIIADVGAEKVVWIGKSREV